MSDALQQLTANAQPEVALAHAAHRQTAEHLYPELLCSREKIQPQFDPKGILGIFAGYIIAGWLV